MLMHGFGLLAPIMDGGRLGTNFFIQPVVKGLERVRDLAVAFFLVHDAVRENELLSRQVEMLAAQVATDEQTRAENKVLREALGFRAKTSLELIPAQVISYDYLNLDQKAVLNRGNDHGVAVGDNVIVAGPILIGIITETTNKTSVMELITSSNMTVNAKTTDGRATGVVRGEHGLGLLLDQVSRSEVLKSSDQVVTSGIGGKFAGNLYIGRVAETRSGASELFQTASVIPAADFRNLEIVFIVKS